MDRQRAQRKLHGMQAFHSDRFEPELPAGHRFPMQKYRLLRERVAATLPEVVLREAPGAALADLLRVHTSSYVEAVRTGSLSPAAQREIGFPWSPMWVERSLRSVGATVAAWEAACVDGVALNLAGGTHHASADAGGGFCVFNDVAVAVRRAQSRGEGRRFAVVDLDVHQGNGTAAIFAGDADVVTVSLHGERNFPFRKVTSALDIGLPDQCDDATYLAALDDALQRLVAWHERQPFDGVFYLAGADVHQGDRLGRLAITDAGVQARDERVLMLAERWRCPLVMCMAGGYGTDLTAMVAVQAQTVGAALASWRRRHGAAAS